MSKNKVEELTTLKEELESLNRKPHELTDDELEQVTGGSRVPDFKPIIDTVFTDTVID